MHTYTVSVFERVPCYVTYISTVHVYTCTDFLSLCPPRPSLPATGEETSRAAATGDIPLTDSGKYISSRQSLTPSPLPSSLDRRHSPSPVFLRAEPHQLRKNSRSSLSPFRQPYTPKKSSRLVFSRVCSSKHFRLLFQMFIVCIYILVYFFKMFTIHISSHFKCSPFVFSSPRESSLQSGRSISRSRTASPVTVRPEDTG